MSPASEDKPGGGLAYRDIIARSPPTGSIGLMIAMRPPYYSELMLLKW